MKKYKLLFWILVTAIIGIAVGFYLGWQLHYLINTA